MKKVVRLTESDLENIVSKVIAETLNEVKIKGRKNKFYLLAPEDPEYKNYLRNQLKNNKNQETPEDFFAEMMGKSNYRKAFVEMDQLMDETSKKVFSTMPFSFQAYCAFFYMRKIDELRKQFITADNPTTMKQMDPTPGMVQEPGFEFTSSGVQFRDQFEFNEAVLSNEFKNYINGLAQKAGEALKLTPNSIGLGELKTINVTASSSRIPNGVSKVTFPGETPTFCQLTEARAKAVEQYVLKAFGAVNIKPGPDFKVNINTEGSNKDCTSGPEWKQGMEKEPYKKFQRADIGFSYAIRTQTPPDKDGDIPDTYPVQTFAVTMGGKQRKRGKTTIIWPKIDLSFGGSGTSKQVTLGCKERR